MFTEFKLDGWTIWGFISQFLFFFSFVVQWYKSETKGESYLPLEFWTLRIIGSLMLLVYVFVRKDIVLFLSLILQMVMYTRNIYLILVKQKKPNGSLNRPAGAQ